MADKSHFVVLEIVDKKLYIFLICGYVEERRKWLLEELLDIE